jgi:hypothetical protein
MCLRCLAHRFRTHDADVGARRMGGQGDRPGSVRRGPEPLGRRGPADGDPLPLKASRALFRDDRTPHPPGMAPVAGGVRRSWPGRGARCPAKGSNVPPCLRSIGLGSLAFSERPLRSEASGEVASRSEVGGAGAEVSGSGAVHGGQSSCARAAPPPRSARSPSPRAGRKSPDHTRPQALME